MSCLCLTVRCRATQTRLFCSPPTEEEKPQPSMLRHLTSKIKATGPIPVAEYMREVLTNPVTVSDNESHWNQSLIVLHSDWLVFSFRVIMWGTTCWDLTEISSHHQKSVRSLERWGWKLIENTFLSKIIKLVTVSPCAVFKCFLKHVFVSTSCSGCGSSVSGWERVDPNICSWWSSDLEKDRWPATSSEYELYLFIYYSSRIWKSCSLVSMWEKTPEPRNSPS